MRAGVREGVRAGVREGVSAGVSAGVRAGCSGGGGGGGSGAWPVARPPRRPQALSVSGATPSPRPQGRFDTAQCRQKKTSHTHTHTHTQATHTHAHRSRCHKQPLPGHCHWDHWGSSSCSPRVQGHSRSGHGTKKGGVKECVWGGGGDQGTAVATHLGTSTQRARDGHTNAARASVQHTSHVLHESANGVKGTEGRGGGQVQCSVGGTRVPESHPPGRWRGRSMRTGSHEAWAGTCSGS